MAFRNAIAGYSDANVKCNNAYDLQIHKMATSPGWVARTVKAIPKPRHTPATVESMNQLSMRNLTQEFLSFVESTFSLNVGADFSLTVSILAGLGLTDRMLILQANWCLIK